MDINTPSSDIAKIHCYNKDIIYTNTNFLTSCCACPVQSWWANKILLTQANMFCSVGHDQLLLLACLAVESQLGLCLPVFGSTKVWTAAEGQVETYFSCSSIFSSWVPLFIVRFSTWMWKVDAVSVSEAIKEVPWTWILSNDWVWGAKGYGILCGKLKFTLIYDLSKHFADKAGFIIWRGNLCCCFKATSCAQFVCCRTVCPSYDSRKCFINVPNICLNWFYDG